MAERHWTALGVSPQVARRLAMLEAHLGLTEGTVRTPVPGYTGNYQAWDEAVYDIRITGGTNPYTGTQIFPVAGGEYALPSPGLQIDGPTWDGVTLFLYEKNGRTDVPVGAVVRARYRGVTGTGDLITEEWEFEWGGGTGPTNTTAPLTIGTPSPVPTPADPHILLQDYPDTTTFTVPDGYIGITNKGGTLIAITPSGRVCILCGGAGCSCCKAGCSPSPELSDFTWVNQGTATVRKNSGGSVTLRSPDGSVSIDTHHLLFSIPAAPYRVDLELDLSLGVTAGKPCAGIAWRESGSGQLHLFWLEVQGGDSTTEISGPAGNFHQMVLRSRKLSAPDTFDADYLTCRAGQVPRFWRLQDDGTNRSLWWSMTGHPNDWLQLDSQTRTNYITPDGATVFADAGESEGAVVVICCLKRYGYQSTDTTTYEELSEAFTSDVHSQLVDVTYEEQSLTAPLAEAVYEEESSATTTDVVSQLVDVTYEDQSESECWPGTTTEDTYTVTTSDSNLTNKTLNKTTDGVNPQEFCSTSFTYASTTVKLCLQHDQSNNKWSLRLIRTSDDQRLVQWDTSPGSSWVPPQSLTKSYDSIGSAPDTANIDSAAVARNNSAAITMTFPNVSAEAGQGLLVAWATIPVSVSSMAWGTDGVDSDNESTVALTDFGSPQVTRGHSSRRVLVSGTHDLVLTLVSASTGVGILQIMNAVNTPTGTTGFGAGTSTTPGTSGITPTDFPNEAYASVVTMETGDTVDGTWGSGFTEVKTAGTNTGGDDVRLSLGNRSNLIGPAGATKTISVSQRWMTYISAYYEA